MSQTDSETKVATVAAWKKNKIHTITLPSSTVVEIAVPDLPTLVKAGQIPSDLVDVAIGVSQGKQITKDDIILQADFYNKLCSLTVINPKVSEEDFANDLLPFEDKEFIVEIATRQRDLDALGQHIGGLDKVKDFTAFRD